jgi:DNA-binding NtrC family response regulator
MFASSPRPTEICPRSCGSGFRSDLYYRVAVVRASVLPLRDRPEDIPLLANHFAAELGVALSGAALSALEIYAWPGNARELRNTIERAAAVSAGGVLEAADLLTAPRPSEPPVTTGSFHEAKDAVILGFERAYVRALLDRHHGQVTAAAREAGLSRPALYALMKRAGLPLS